MYLVSFRSVGLKSALVALATFGCAIPGAGAQADPDATQSRAETLRAVPEKVCSEPNEEDRIVSMEEIVRDGDPVKTLIAVRCALASDEPALRSVGLRAYLASTPQFRLDVVVDKALVTQYEQLDDRRKRGQLASRHPHLQYVIASGSSVTFTVSGFDFDKGQGKIGVDPRASWDLTVRSDRIIFAARFPTDRNGNCTYDLRPTPAYRMVGTVRCEGWPTLNLEGDLL